MLVVSPKERIPLVDILLDKELQRAVENPHDGINAPIGSLYLHTILGHWYE